MIRFYHLCILFSIFGILQLSSCKENNDGITQSGSNTSPTFNIQVPPNPVTTQIPLEYDGLMSVIECQLNGITCKMMLDTGSETICLFENKLDKFNLEVIGKAEMGYTAGGIVESNRVERFVIEFPDHIKIAANNCPVLPAFPDKPDIDGIIGGPVFVTLKATIDYDKKVLTFKTSGAIQSVNNESNMSDNIDKENDH